VDRALAAGASIQVMTNIEVENFTVDSQGKFNGVQLHERATGRRHVYQARRYALAGGAIGSPALLLRSGMRQLLIGQNYMVHLSPIVAGIFPTCTGAEATFIKQVGFSDYYFGTKSYAHKLGMIQSLPVPGPLMLAKATSGRLPLSLLQFLRKRMLPLAGIVEDLPNPANRVTLGTDGTAEVRHTFGSYDLDRGRRLGGFMSQILKAAGALFCLRKLFPSEEHVAHQCGTLRFGNGAAHAVLDRDCRLYEQPNVFVVDGSFFPTSLGVAPALTIMANALRVACVVTGEL
jgi:choline dehydrogenase-like flavoprotein